MTKRISLDPPAFLHVSGNSEGAPCEPEGGREGSVEAIHFFIPFVGRITFCLYFIYLNDFTLRLYFTTLLFIFIYLYSSNFTSALSSFINFIAFTQWLYFFVLDDFISCLYLSIFIFVCVSVLNDFPLFVFT